MARVTIHERDLLKRPPRSIASGLREHRLPAVCIRCGEPATSWFRKEFSGPPLWTLLILPVALVLTAISKRWTLDLPVCARHADPWRDRHRFRELFMKVGSMGAFVILGFGLLTSLLMRITSPNIALVPLTLGLCSWLVAVLGLMTARLVFVLLSIRPTWISAKSITLTGVSRRFVDTLERQRRGEKPVDIDEEPGVPDLPPDDRIRR